ncbi:uncharacterized protein G2W53_007794 [Senna tora]|uniref:Uncharacterized protein n=1 Tax=Senna tora TaxID=362788 RepID=A0A835CHL3_9FABA|nr:uncharacterized protein G2W53_007794 [Senna tora]
MKASKEVWLEGRKEQFNAKNDALEIPKHISEVMRRSGYEKVSARQPSNLISSTIGSQLYGSSNNNVGLGLSHQRTCGKADPSQAVF